LSIVLRALLAPRAAHAELMRTRPNTCARLRQIGALAGHPLPETPARPANSFANHSSNGPSTFTSRLA
jgi:hypothetical protein